MARAASVSSAATESVLNSEAPGTEGTGPATQAIPSVAQQSELYTTVLGEMRSWAKVDYVAH
jgi:hypothetical protein